MSEEQPQKQSMPKKVAYLGIAIILALFVVLVGLYAILSTLQERSSPVTPISTVSDEQKMQVLANLSSSSTLPASQQTKVLKALNSSALVSDEDKVNTLQQLH